MNAKFAKKMRRHLRSGVIEMYQEAASLPLNMRLQIAWKLLIGSKDWSRIGRGV